ncbi:PAS domain S-box protein [Aquibium sp. A9E412]|uniref:PAS domain S-box protein n=1 Tax=Aquibium sp. A9E412 TaxID=2976767 RepID=UPI0025AF5241|nr:PAS domain S-box protein [Aquibium sp. A9E412]MDN2567588.1 PAS domain S-box protein [Aquibium sp. A9E412]
MASASHSFIDIAVLDDVRGRFAAGEALLVLSQDLATVLWANGAGAALLGFDGIEAAIGAPASLPPAARRQIAATPGFPRIGRDRTIAVRLTGRLASRLVRFSASAVVLPDGEPALLLAVPVPDADTRSADEAARRAIAGFGEAEHCAAFLDAGGAVLAASPGFAALGLAAETLAGLVGEVRAEEDRLVKRLVAAPAGRLPAGIARLTDAPATHLLLVVDEPVAAAPAAPRPQAANDSGPVAPAPVPRAATDAAADAPPAQPQADTTDTGPAGPAGPQDEAGHDGWYFADRHPEAAPPVERGAPPTRQAAPGEAEAPARGAGGPVPPRGAPIAQDSAELGAVPVRFVWKTDAEGRFTALAEEFVRAVGPTAADVIGRRFVDVARVFSLDPDGEIAGLLERRDTWSGRTVLWPVAGTDLKVPVDLAALPVYSRERAFQGFRGFGIARMGDVVVDPEALGMALVPGEPPAGAPAQRAEDGASAAPPDTPPGAVVPEPEAPAQQPVAKGEPEAPAAGSKVIRLSERRVPAREGGLTPHEQTAFREIGDRLRTAYGAEETPAGETGPAAGEDTRAASPDAARFDDGEPTPPAAAGEADAADSEPAAPAAEAGAPAADAAPDGETGAAAPGEIAEGETGAAAPDEAVDGEAEAAAPDEAVDGEAEAAGPDKAEAAPAPPAAASDAGMPAPAEQPAAAAGPTPHEPAEPAEPAADETAARPPEDAEAGRPPAVDEPVAGSEPEAEPVPGSEPEPAAGRHAAPAFAAPGSVLPAAFAGAPPAGAAPAAPPTALLDPLPLAVLVQSAERLHHANPAFLALSGHDSLAALEAAGGLEALFAEPPAADGTAARALRLRRADGTQVAVEASLHPVRWQAGRALLMALRPVEERPEPAAAVIAQANALEAELTEMRTIIDTATDGVVLIDNDGTIRSISRPAEALFGFDAADVTGKPFVALFAMESRRAAEDYLAGLADNGVASVLNDGREVIGREAQGRFIPLFMTIGRLPNRGGYCAVLRDITQWKRAEEDLTQARAQAERASSQKTEFLARVSHEIRTPLNAIIGFSELMSDEKFGPIGNDRYRDYLRDINRSGNHVLDLVNDLLDISKIEAGEQEMHYEAVSLNDTLAEAVAMMQPQANRERVIIRSSLASGLPEVVADLRSVRQIALNLLSNAIRYTSAGGQVIVSTAYEPSGAVVMRFRDTGIGMSSAEIDEALKPFKQINALRRKRGEGTGLGLPLTRAMVEANRARFAISSAPGEGTLVEISFPPTRVLAE